MSKRLNNISMSIYSVLAVCLLLFLGGAAAFQLWDAPNVNRYMYVGMAIKEEICYGMNARTDKWHGIAFGKTNIKQQQHPHTHYIYNTHIHTYILSSVRPTLKSLFKERTCFQSASKTDLFIFLAFSPLSLSLQVLLPWLMEMTPLQLEETVQLLTRLSLSDFWYCTTTATTSTSTTKST